MLTKEIAMTVANVTRRQFNGMMAEELSSRSSHNMAFTIGLRQWNRVGHEYGYNEVWHTFFGDTIQAEEFLPYAQGKAKLSARTALPSGVVLDTRPDLIRPGDVRYRGGYAQPDSLVVVALSGIESWLDEALAASAFHVARSLMGLKVDQGRGLSFSANAPAFLSEDTFNS